MVSGHALFVTTIIQLPLFSGIANYSKEIRIAKYSMRGDVCGHVLSPPLSIRGRDANRQFLRNASYTCAQLRYLVSHTWYTRAQLRYLVSHTSLGIGWEALMHTVCTKYPT